MAITIRHQDSEDGELIIIKCKRCSGKYKVSLGRGIYDSDSFDTLEECKLAAHRRYSTWKTFKI